ncbi:hypothetical protein QJS10_CPB17g00665 [Acorus calamus]|uniref:Uncharacterized protein n=1 Tax=Acorus calamus TaxID=4465 RepID=A0AAV9CTR1_ACOCL|nr:hypothetical protein QJS10_CPB17g00665 [Acorus calamus]
MEDGDLLFLRQEKVKPNARHVFVDIGLGFHVEFTWSEALDFISKKEARLERNGDGDEDEDERVITRGALAEEKKRNIKRKPIFQTQEEVTPLHMLKRLVGSHMCPNNILIQLTFITADILGQENIHHY